MRRARSESAERARLSDGPGWTRCEALIKAFEEAWGRGEAPALSAYLEHAGTLRLALLVELAHADLEFRLKAGQAIRVEEYLSRYPELAEDGAAVLGLAMAECDLRRYLGEEIGRASCRERG